jgi:hypothetical protein
MLVACTQLLEFLQQEVAWPLTLLWWHVVGENAVSQDAQAFSSMMLRRWIQIIVYPSLLCRRWHAKVCNRIMRLQMLSYFSISTFTYCSDSRQKEPCYILKFLLTRL